jgi:hypothetical protein
VNAKLSQTLVAAVVVLLGLGFGNLWLRVQRLEIAVAARSEGGPPSRPAASLGSAGSGGVPRVSPPEAPVSAPTPPPGSAVQPPALSPSDLDVQRTRPGACSGSVGTDQLFQFTRAHLPALKGCLRGEDLHAVGRGQRIGVRVRIDATGTVTDALIAGFGSASAHTCLREQALRWTFPAPQGGDCATVEIPLAAAP